MYVAITRAKKRLYLTRARSRFLYGSRRMTVQSEFLDDMSDALGVPKERGYGGYYQGGYSNQYGDSYGYQQKTQYGYQKPTQESSKRSSFGYSGSDEPSYTPSFGGLGKGAFASSYKNNFTNSFNSTKKAQSSAPNKNTDKFHTGVKVMHKKFGEGTIIELKPNGDDTIGVIAFKGVGIKQLVLRLAPIEVIE